MLMRYIAYTYPGALVNGAEELKSYTVDPLYFRGGSLKETV